MSTKRRVGVSAATTEAARRQLMQPVQCWEKVWTVPEGASASTLRVLRWVRTSKTQHFSDDEGAADEPLAPLPDDVEVVDGDDDEQDENATALVPPEALEAAVPEEELLSKPASPKPQLSMGVMDDPEGNDALDDSLKVMETNMDQGVGVGLDDADSGLMDISSLAPDGLALEGTHDLSQMGADDALLGGPLQMDDSGDPFAEP
ncbi:hypothetical protein GGX14DRAFT_371309 [Mycena pura]|uniref:Uncharacterized protein n=1 Tax=Mycena pura TaxID=153505 RepID=A0AAD6V2T0_9AGAR|nr:hypothetical protein GGX14DRAFT_371309 [Mycena pura]